jgi:hypothetical protein
MTEPSKQELQIIQAFSSVDVPERIIRESNIKGLLHDMIAEQDAVQSGANRLERLRQEKKDGNIIGNWWNDRDDKVQDAQIDLNQSIGRLTQKSSQLLIVNTAISKVLRDQQYILLNQQEILKQQTDKLEEQNNKILEQQKLLEKQQKDINQANQGLMEAKGLTQEQAQKLVGCVNRVTEAEHRISEENQVFRLGLRRDISELFAQCLERLEAGLAEQQQRRVDFEQQINDAFSAQSNEAQTELKKIIFESIQIKSALEAQMESNITALWQHREEFEQQLTSAFSTQSKYAQAELARYYSETTEFKIDIGKQLQAHIHSILEITSAQDATAQQLRETISDQLKNFQQEQAKSMQTQSDALELSVQRLEANLCDKAEALNRAEVQLSTIYAEQKRSASRNRMAFAAVACLALASLGWQVAQHFALV